MASKTVLEYVQHTLNTMDSDRVDAIAETEESLQVADFLKEAYYELLNREEWKFLDGAATLIAAADLTRPTSFAIQGSVKFIHYVAYNVADDGSDAEYRNLKYLEPVEFLRKYNVPGDDRLLVNIDDKVSFYVGTNKQPEWFTSFGDDDIVCDSYDSDIDSTLTSTKVNVYANTIPDFEVEDSFTPDIPRHMEPLLQSTLNSVSHLYLNQSVSAPDEKRVGRQMAQARRSESKITRRKYYTRQYGRR